MALYMARASAPCQTVDTLPRVQDNLVERVVVIYQEDQHQEDQHQSVLRKVDMSLDWVAFHRSPDQ